MCVDPVTLAVGATLLTAGGQVYNGVRQSQEQAYVQKVANNNATLERQAAQDSIDRGNKEEARHWQQVAALRSQQIADFAANGFDTTFGSPVDVVKDTDYLGAVDAQTIRENTQREARGFLISAQNYDQDAEAAKRASKDALVSTAFDVAGTVIGGAQQVRGIRTQRNPLGNKGTAGPRAATSAIATPGWARGGVY